MFGKCADYLQLQSILLNMQIQQVQFNLCQFERRIVHEFWSSSFVPVTSHLTVNTFYSMCLHSRWYSRGWQIGLV